MQAKINLLRVADPNRYPAYFYHQGFKYKLTIEKMASEVADDE